MHKGSVEGRSRVGSGSVGHHRALESAPMDPALVGRWRVVDIDVLAEGKTLTRDLGGSAGTSDFADAIIAKMK